MRTRGNATVVEIIVPMRNRLGHNDMCTICAHEYCVSNSCAHNATNLSCCGQSVCCGCIAKMSKRCTCSEECEAVIVICPFCREITPISALDILSGSRPSCGCDEEVS
jgi:hypothetical protein